MRKVLALGLATAGLTAIAATPPATALADEDATAAKKKKKGKGKGKTFTVCKRGCKYRTIQKAVDKAGKKKGKNDVVKVRPGKYSEGVLVKGSKHNGLTIMGTKKNPKKTILDGKNATNENGVAQNGIEGFKVKNLTVKNLWARNYATNGVFVNECSNYKLTNLRVSFNRSYGLYAFSCKGGEMSKSVGYGHGDSAYYVGQTPPQKGKPKKNVLNKLESYKNVLGFSGTNARYTTIKNSYFYNNGAGVVPNTLDSEKFEPATDGVIKNNYIFWNNFNYHLPNSPVQGVGTGGLGEILGSTVNYPLGIGVVLFGTDNWRVENNEIFGNYKWGSAVFSNPENKDDDAIAQNNALKNNKNGRDGTDPNGVDYFSDGSGSGNCYSGNVSQTLDSSVFATDEELYPPCPGSDATGTGTSDGDEEQQLIDLLFYAASDPAETQECSWKKTEHPTFKDYKPFELTPGPVCP